MDTYYTPDEIAERLKIHLQTVLSYIKDGRIKALKLDKGYRISETDLQRFIRSTQPIVSAEDYFERVGYDKKYKSFRKTMMKPVKPLASKIPNINLPSFLENASVKNREGYRAFPFPALSIMGEEQKRLPTGVILEKEINFAGLLFFFAFASNSGEVFTAESLWEDSEVSRLENSIGLLSCIGTIYRGLLFIPKYYSQIPYDKNIKFAFIVDRPLNRLLAMDSNKGGRIWFGDHRATTEEPIILERVVSSTMTPDEAKTTTNEMIKEFLWYFKCELNEKVIGELIEEVTYNIIT